MFKWLKFSGFCVHHEVTEFWFEWKLSPKQNEALLRLIPTWLETGWWGRPKFLRRRWKRNWKLRMPRLMEINDSQLEDQGPSLLVHETLRGDFNEHVHQLTQVVLRDMFGTVRDDYFLLSFRRSFT